MVVRDDFGALVLADDGRVGDALEVDHVAQLSGRHAREEPIDLQLLRRRDPLRTCHQSGRGVLVEPKRASWWA